MENRIHNLGLMYVDGIAAKRKRTNERPLTEDEDELMASAYEQGYLDGIRRAETAAVYSSRDVLQAIRELRQ